MLISIFIWKTAVIFFIECIRIKRDVSTRIHFQLGQYVAPVLIYANTSLIQCKIWRKYIQYKLYIQTYKTGICPWWICRCHWEGASSLWRRWWPLQWGRCNCKVVSGRCTCSYLVGASFLALHNYRRVT